MITVIDAKALKTLISISKIVEVSPCRASPCHGIRSIIRLEDGRVIECRDDVDVVAGLINAATRLHANTTVPPSIDPLGAFAVIAPVVDAGYHRWAWEALKAHFDGADIPPPVRDDVATAR